MEEALAALVGNPSSVHREGRLARQRVEAARDAVAALFGAGRDEVVFTSGGSEANLQMVRTLAAECARRGRRRLMVSPADHPSLRLAAETAGVDVEPLPLDHGAGRPGHGRIVLDELAARLASPDVGGIALGWVNHELGTVQPLAEIARLAAARGVLVAVDAVQGIGRYPLDAPSLGVDLCTISAHKIGGPQGVGALYARRGLDVVPVLIGGSQERDRRPGTENQLGILGFGAAARALADEREARVAQRAALGAELRAGLLAIGAELASAEDAAPGLVNLAFPGVPGALLVEALDLAGFAVSTGAACSSGTIKPSPVLLAVGYSPERAKRGVRVSLGAENDAAEVARFLAALPSIVERIRQS